MKTVVKLMVLSSRRILGRGGHLRSRRAKHGAVSFSRLGKRLERAVERPAPEPRRRGVRRERLPKKSHSGDT